MKTALDVCKEIVRTYEGDGMENMRTRDHVFYKICKEVIDVEASIMQTASNVPIKTAGHKQDCDCIECRLLYKIFNTPLNMPLEDAYWFNTVPQKLRSVVTRCKDYFPTQETNTSVVLCLDDNRPYKIDKARLYKPSYYARKLNNHQFT